MHALGRHPARGKCMPAQCSQAAHQKSGSGARVGSQVQRSQLACYSRNNALHCYKSTSAQSKSTTSKAFATPSQVQVKCDVAIIGENVPAMATALYLLRRGLKVLLLGGLHDPTATAQQVYELDVASQKILARLGVELPEAVSNICVLHLHTGVTEEVLGGDRVVIARAELEQAVRNALGKARKGKLTEYTIAGLDLIDIEKNQLQAPLTSVSSKGRAPTLKASFRFAVASDGPTSLVRGQIADAMDDFIVNQASAIRYAAPFANVHLTPQAATAAKVAAQQGTHQATERSTAQKEANPPHESLESGDRSPPMVGEQENDPVERRPSPAAGFTAQGGGTDEGSQQAGAGRAAQQPYGASGGSYLESSATAQLLGPYAAPYSLHIFRSLPGTPAGTIRLIPKPDGSVSGHVIYSGTAEVRDLLLNSFPQIPRPWLAALSQAVEENNVVRLGETYSTKMLTLFTLVLVGDAAYGQRFLSPTLINGMLRDCRALDRAVKDAKGKLGDQSMREAYNSARRTDSVAMLVFEGLWWLRLVGDEHKIQGLDQFMYGMHVTARGVLKRVGFSSLGGNVQERLVDVGFGFKEAQQMVRSDSLFISSAILSSIVGAVLMVRWGW